MLKDVVNSVKSKDEWFFTVTTDPAITASIMRDAEKFRKQRIVHIMDSCSKEEFFCKNWCSNLDIKDFLLKKKQCITRVMQTSWISCEDLLSINSREKEYTPFCKNNKS